MSNDVHNPHITVELDMYCNIDIYKRLYFVVIILDVLLAVFLAKVITANSRHIARLFSKYRLYDHHSSSMTIRTWSHRRKKMRLILKMAIA